jgi:hypothetical protein
MAVKPPRQPFRNSIVLCCLLACMAAARAGSPGGLSIAAVAGEGSAPYTSAVRQFLADYKADGIECGEYALNLENVYTANLPLQLTGDLAMAAVKDKAKRKQLGKILTGYRDKTLTHGFDGALVYEVKGTQLRLYGISGSSGLKVVVSSLPVGEAKDQKKFDIAACKAVASLPVLTVP